MRRMKTADYLRLVALAAIWGASFIFTRVVAPSLGAIWTAELRVLLGGFALLAWLRFAGFDAGLRRHWRYYLAVGTVNSAIPFALYAYAAIHLPASLLSIVNATSPMFGMLFGALSGTERVTLKKLAGLALGAAGVALVAQPGSLRADAAFYLPVAAALGACAGYGLTGVLVRRWGRDVPARGVAAGQQLAAAAVLAPLLLLAPLPAAPSALVVGNVLAVALLASAVAFLIYFRLIADVGATRALTVTFLIPVFGVLWGRLFLGEALPAGMLGGGVLIVAGTILVTRG
jgi:drug/metabolite transporter (DMT)-like permease